MRYVYVDDAGEEFTAVDFGNSYIIIFGLQQKYPQEKYDFKSADYSYVRKKLTSIPEIEISEIEKSVFLSWVNAKKWLDHKLIKVIFSG